MIGGNGVVGIADNVVVDDAGAGVVEDGDRTGISLHVGDNVILEIERAVETFGAIAVLNAAEVDVLDSDVRDGHCRIGNGLVVIGDDAAAGIDVSPTNHDTRRMVRVVAVNGQILDRHVVRLDKHDGAAGGETLRIGHGRVDDRVGLAGAGNRQALGNDHVLGVGAGCNSDRVAVLGGGSVDGRLYGSEERAPCGVFDGSVVDAGGRIEAGLANRCAVGAAGQPGGDGGRAGFAVALGADVVGVEGRGRAVGAAPPVVGGVDRDGGFIIQPGDGIADCVEQAGSRGVVGDRVVVDGQGSRIERYAVIDIDTAAGVVLNQVVLDRASRHIAKEIDAVACIAVVSIGRVVLDGVAVNRELPDITDNPGEGSG